MSHWTLRAGLFALATLAAGPAFASGHGPVFGAATPTLGRGGWSLDQTWALRAAESRGDQQMLKTMISFGVTENLQISASAPLVMSNGGTAPARMMSMMSSDRDLEALVGYRFQRRTLGVGARQESTLYVGGTAPLESRRDHLEAPASLEISGATGYASRAHYVWVGGGLQHFVERAGSRAGEARFLTAVYGYRPRPLRAEGRPDLRFFVEATAEDRAPTRIGGIEAATGARSVFAGPTALFLHKSIGVEGGVLFPVYQRADAAFSRERLRVAVDVSYFFWVR